MAPLIKGRILETVARWPKQWFFSCTLMLEKNDAENDYRNIVQFTDGPDRHTYGSRIVALFTNDFNRLYFFTFVYEKDGTLSPLLYHTQLVLGKEYEISIRYMEDTIAGNFRYEISLNGKLFRQKVSWKTEDLSDVKIYASNRYNEPSSALVKNLRYGKI